MVLCALQSVHADRMHRRSRTDVSRGPKRCAAGRSQGPRPRNKDKEQGQSPAPRVQRPGSQPGSHSRTGCDGAAVVGDAIGDVVRCDSRAEKGSKERERKMGCDGWGGRVAPLPRPARSRARSQRDAVGPSSAELSPTSSGSSHFSGLPCLPSFCLVDVPEGTSQSGKAPLTAQRWDGHYPLGWRVSMHDARR